MLAHTRSGTGEPLILVHGITHRREAWDTVTPYLEKEHDVIAVDLPGHGDSDDVEPDFDGSPRPLVDAVEGLARDLGLERPHVAGNSLGGLIALEMAARGTVASATALSPAGFWSPVGRAWARGVLLGASTALRHMSPERLDRVLAGAAGRAALTGLIMAHPGRQDPEVLARGLQGLARPREGFAAMLGGLDRWTTPRRSDVPTMVGWGSRDYLLPRAQNPAPAHGAARRPRRRPARVRPHPDGRRPGAGGRGDPRERASAAGLSTSPRRAVFPGKLAGDRPGARPRKSPPGRKKGGRALGWRSRRPVPTPPTERWWAEGAPRVRQVPPPDVESEVGQDDQGEAGHQEGQEGRLGRLGLPHPERCRVIGRSQTEPVGNRVTLAHEEELAARGSDQRRVARVVAARAIDVEDCRELLGMLGLAAVTGMPERDTPTR